MSDLVKCSKCGKETSKYAPGCEYCATPFARETPKPAHEGEALRGNLAAAEPKGEIEEKGQRLHEVLRNETERLKKCPFCAEEIRSDARKCRYCGEDLVRTGHSAGRKVFWTVVLAGVAAGIVALAAFSVPYLSGAGFFKSGHYNEPDAISIELKKDPVKAAYVKNNLTLDGVGTLDETSSSSAMPEKYIYGTIRNSGSKRVIKVAAIVYYLDKKGKRIAEETVFPVRGTKLKPDSIKPNTSKDFQCLIVPGAIDWSGRIKVKITDIELVD